MTTQGQGPLNDPRLIERRGDLSGLNAALFVILVIAAFAAAAYLLATVLHGGGAGASPSPVATAAVASSSAAPLPSASPAPVSTPTGLPSPSVAASAALRQPVPVVIDGQTLGTVTVLSVQFPTTVGGKKPPAGVRWLAARVRYDATASLPYDDKDWSIMDSGGVSYAWAGVDFKPALGHGTLDPGAERIGNVTFKAPLHGALWLIFSGGDGEQRLQLVQLSTP